MGIHLGRVGHIGIHVSDVDRSIDFYRKVLGLKVTGRWGPPDFGRPICFMRIKDKHHDVVLFELSEDVRKAGITSTDSRIRRAPGLDHIAFEVELARALAPGARPCALLRREDSQWSLRARPRGRRGGFRRR